MEPLDIKLEDDKRLEIDGSTTCGGNVCIDITGEYSEMYFLVNEDEAEEIISHLSKVFDLGIAITSD